MIVEFWGVRGTTPVSGRQYLKYGGNTNCLSIVSRTGDILIIDAGTGIRNLGLELAGMAERTAKKPLKLHLLFTHFHLDHVAGLPFFIPLYSKRAVLDFYSPVPAAETEKYLSGLMKGRYFPISFGDTPAVKRFHRIGPEGLKIGSLKITFEPLNHPGGSFAYKIEEEKTSLVVAVDTEPDNGPFDASLLEFCRNTDCLAYDSTFSPAELRRLRGFGHGTWLSGVKLARAAGAGLLILSHLNPGHNDRRITSMLSRARRMFPRTKTAREGLSLRIRRK